MTTPLAPTADRTAHRIAHRTANRTADRTADRSAPAERGGSAPHQRGLTSVAWASHRRRLAAAVAVAAAYGLAVGWWTPRGPVTTPQALTTLAASLVTGGLVGLLMRSRWAMLLAPLVFASVFELVRFGAAGPTVDGLDLGGVYGVLAAASGRGLHGLLALIPMVLGASLGAARARHTPAETAVRSRRSGRLGRARLVARRGVAILTATGLALFAMLLARPAATAAILGADGHPLPGSVAELTSARVGQHDLSMMIRGADSTNPVLLFLAGGPGGSELGAMRHHGEALEEDFVVVTLDQRATGRSYDQLEPTSTFTLAGAVQDVVDVTTYLRKRFGHDQIYLVGQSWGTLIGVLAAQAQPELFHAFVGVGQMVNPRETDRIIYQDTVAWARKTSNAALVQELTAIGPPPYENLLHYPAVLGHEQDVYPYDHSVNAEGKGQMMEGLPAEEYSLLDTVNVVRGLLDSFALMYPQLQKIDFRVDVPRLEVPVYLIQGRHEPRGRAQLASQWFKTLHAPSKHWVEFDTSGHRPLFEQPRRFAEVMSATVLAETSHTR